MPESPEPEGDEEETDEPRSNDWGDSFDGEGDWEWEPAPPARRGFSHQGG